MTKLNVYELGTLNDFILDKTKSDTYFNIIHNYNKYNNYNFFSDFIKKLSIQKKELKHYMEFTKHKYKYEHDKKDLYKKNIDKYLNTSKMKPNKYCLDMSMKAGNYEAGIYLIEHYKVHPDDYTLIFIKDLNRRSDFLLKYLKKS